MLSSTIVGTALPTLSDALHSSFAGVQWIATGYLLALAAGVPLSAWAARRFGVTRLWLGSLALCCCCSIWCAESKTLHTLMFGRVLQGLSGGLLVPAGQTISGIIAGPRRLGRVMSVIGIAVVLAPTLGTTLGSILLTHFSWPWLFWVNVPLCAIAFGAGLRWLPAVRTGAAGQLDWVGLFLALSGLPLFIYGVSVVGTAGTLYSVKGDLITLCGLGTLAAFALWALRVRSPLLQLRLFKETIFLYAALIMFLGGAVSFGAQIVLPLYFTQVRHESLLAAGLLMGPQVIGTAIGFPLAGWLTDRYGAGRLLLAGGVITALATVPLGFADAETGMIWLGFVLFGRGLGVALATIPAMTAGFAAVSSDQLPDAAPILNMLQRTGASIGTALLSVLYSSHALHYGTPTHAAEAFRHTSWWLFALTCLLTFPCYFLISAEQRKSQQKREEAPLETLSVQAI